MRKLIIILSLLMPFQFALAQSYGDDEGWKPDVYDYLPLKLQNSLNYIMDPVTDKNAYNVMLLADISNLENCLVHAQLQPSQIALTIYDDNTKRLSLFNVPLQKAWLSRHSIRDGNENYFLLVFDEKPNDDSKDIISVTYFIKLYISNDGSKVYRTTMESIQNTIYRGVFMSLVGKISQNPAIKNGENLDCIGQ